MKIIKKFAKNYAFNLGILGSIIFTIGFFIWISTDKPDLGSGEGFLLILFLFSIIGYLALFIFGSIIDIFKKNIINYARILGLVLFFSAYIIQLLFNFSKTPIQANSIIIDFFLKYAFFSLIYYVIGYVLGFLLELIIKFFKKSQ